MENLKRCFVPFCHNNNLKNPLKLFMYVPELPEKREKWFAAVGKESVPKGHHYYCCEDHFNLKEDSKNWLQYSFIPKSTRLLLKEDVIPHKNLIRATKRISTSALAIEVLPSACKEEIQQPFKKRKIEEHENISNESMSSQSQDKSFESATNASVLRGKWLEEQQETQDRSSNIEERQPSGPSFDIKEEITIDEDDLSLLNIEKYENGNDGLTDVLSEVEISTSPEVVLQSTSAKPSNKKRKVRDNFSNVPNLETVENANEDNLGVELPIVIQNQTSKKRILRSTFKDNINFSPSNSKKSNRKKRKLSDKNGNVEDEFGMSIAARLRNANQSDRAKAIAKQKIELILCDLEQGVFEDAMM